MNLIKNIINMAKAKLTDSSSTGVSENWAISVIGKDDKVVKKFDNLVEAMTFAREGGYRIHAE